MDIFSHGLWAGAAARAAVQSGTIQRPLSFWHAAWWGVFPDIFAFSYPFVVLLWIRLTDPENAVRFERIRELEPLPPLVESAITLAGVFYNLSHSAVIFGGILVLLRLLLRRTPWEMFGWGLHILFDVPTHSYDFYPTPVLWPISGWKFDGIAWGQPWFMVLNYSALATVYLALLYQARRKKHRDRLDNVPMKR